MPLRGTESTFELTTLQRLDALKYQHAFGMDIERPRGGASLSCEVPEGGAKPKD